MYITRVTSGAGTEHLFWTPELTPALVGVRVSQTLVVRVVFCISLLCCCLFSFGHCSVCPSLIGSFFKRPLETVCGFNRQLWCLILMHDKTYKKRLFVCLICTLYKWRTCHNYPFKYSPTGYFITGGFKQNRQWQSP